MGVWIGRKSYARLRQGLAHVIWRTMDWRKKRRLKWLQYSSTTPAPSSEISSLSCGFPYFIFLNRLCIYVCLGRDYFSASEIRGDYRRLVFYFIYLADMTRNSLPHLHRRYMVRIGGGAGHGIYDVYSREILCGHLS